MNAMVPTHVILYVFTVDLLLIVKDVEFVSDTVER